jgi:hypothetical protein
MAGNNKKPSERLMVVGSNNTEPLAVAWSNRDKADLRRPPAERLKAELDACREAARKGEITQQDLAEVEAIYKARVAGGG